MNECINIIFIGFLIPVVAVGTGLLIVLWYAISGIIKEQKEVEL